MKVATHKLFKFVRYLNRFIKLRNKYSYPQLEYYYKNKDKIKARQKAYYHKHLKNKKN